MSSSVTINFRLAVVEGQLDSLRQLADEMIDATQNNEEGTLSNEWFVSADGKTCHIAESFANSEALINHLSAFGEKYSQRFLACVTLTELVVHGRPNDDASEMLAGLTPLYLESLGGFRR